MIDPSPAITHSFAMIKRATLIFLIAVAATAGQAHASSLAGSEWGLGGKDQRFIQFGSGGKVSGHAGCNRFFADYARTTLKLMIGPVATTRKFCPPAQMKQEREWLGLLKRVRAYEATHLKLTLYGAKRTVLVVLVRRDFD
jgi:heat shock protein HslJ